MPAPPPGDAWVFDPWVPPEVQAQTIAWAQNERPVTPAEYDQYWAQGKFGPWGVRPEIGACAGRGGTWSPDPSAETSNGLGGRCTLADGQVCDAVAYMRGHCPGPVVPDPVVPDPIDPWVTPPPTGERPGPWLLVIALLAALR